MGTVDLDDADGKEKLFRAVQRNIASRTLAVAVPLNGEKVVEDLGTAEPLPGDVIITIRGQEVMISADDLEGLTREAIVLLS